MGTLFVVIAILCWGFYDVLYSKFSPHFAPATAFLLITLIQALLFGIGYLIFENTGKINFQHLPTLIIAAILLSAGNIAFILAFKIGIPVSVALPALSIGIAILGALWGIIVEKEPLTVPLVLGIILATVGVVLINLKSSS
ncbi:MAG: hypothetical protein C4584_01825 [Armatimonadetes bacterium]|nr:MAG: hypothetical protein C4584_01825 [Armatimonadota bacterium]